MQFTVGRITPLVAVQRMCRNELCSQPSMLSQVSQPTENLTTFLALSLVSSYVGSVSACLFDLFHLSVFFLGSYPCQSVGESVDGVIDGFRCDDIASLSFASLSENKTLSGPSPLLNLFCRCKQNHFYGPCVYVLV